MERLLLAAEEDRCREVSIALANILAEIPELAYCWTHLSAPVGRGAALVRLNVAVWFARHVDAVVVAEGKVIEFTDRRPIIEAGHRAIRAVVYEQVRTGKLGGHPCEVGRRIREPKVERIPPRFKPLHLIGCRVCRLVVGAK